jgi:hypothetical protein
MPTIPTRDFNQGVDGLYVPNFLQAFSHQCSLVRRQFLKFVGQRLKLLGFHRRSYLIDFYKYSIGHYLTVT